MPSTGIPGAPTGGPLTWPTPPGGTWRLIDQSPGGCQWALDAPAGTGYLGYDHTAGHWFTDLTGDEADMAEHPSGDEAIRALADALGPRAEDST
jgi:hypothetical protein